MKQIEYIRSHCECIWCVALPCMKCHCLCQHPMDIIPLLCVQSICNLFGTIPSRKRQQTSRVMEISSKPTTTNDDQSRHETQRMSCPLYLDRLSRVPWLSFWSLRSMLFEAKRSVNTFILGTQIEHSKQLTLSLSSDSSCFVAPSSATSFRPSLAGSPLRQKLQMT